MRKLIALALALVMVFALCACGGSSAPAAPAATESAPAAAESAAEPVVIRAVCMGAYEPYFYVNEAGELDGWDIQVAKLIDAMDDRFTVEFFFTDWAGVLPGVDADYYDVALNQLSWTAARDEGYVYGEWPYSTSCTQIIVNAKDKDTIASLEDLHGKVIGTTIGSFFTMKLEEYLEENPGAFELKYYEESTSYLIDELAAERFDAFLDDPVIVMDRAAIQGVSDLIVSVGEPLFRDSQFPVFQNSEKGVQYAQWWDEDLKVLFENGDLFKLREELFGSGDDENYLLDLNYLSERTPY